MSYWRFPRPTTKRALMVLALALPVLAGTGPSGPGVAGASTSSAAIGITPPTQAMTPQKSIGKGEGQLTLIAWEGYVQPEWVKPFEKQTGCRVNAKYAGSSSEMVSLMANGGGGQYDLVSASGDADLRLIYGGAVKPVNIKLVPSWKQFRPFLQSPAFNTINGVHYGVSLQFGPNDLLYSTKAFPSAPTSWSVIYSKAYAGRVTVPNNPIQIADAALYLSVHDRALARDHRPIRADPTAIQRSGEPAQTTEAAHQEVLEPRLRRDLALPKRRGRRGRILALPDWAAPGGRGPCGRHHPQRGSYGLGRLLAAGHQGAPPQLCLRLDGLHLDPQGPSRAGCFLRGDTGQFPGLPAHGQVVQRLLRVTPRQRARCLFQDDQVLEDPPGAMWQWQV